MQIASFVFSGDLIRARINDCHRRTNYANDKLLLCLSKLKELIPTSLLDTLTTIADKRANKTTEQHHAIVQSKLTRLQHAAHKKRHKTDKNWVRNISSRPLDELLLLNGYQPTILYRVLSPFWPVRGSYQNRLRTTSGAE